MASGNERWRLRRGARTRTSGYGNEVTAVSTENVTCWMEQTGTDNALAGEEAIRKKKPTLFPARRGTTLHGVARTIPRVGHGCRVWQGLRAGAGTVQCVSGVRIMYGRDTASVGYGRPRGNALGGVLQ